MPPRPRRWRLCPPRRRRIRTSRYGSSCRTRPGRAPTSRPAYRRAAGQGAGPAGLHRQQARRRRQHRHASRPRMRRPTATRSLMGTVATRRSTSSCMPWLEYEPAKDFAPIILVGMLPMVISADPSFPANSLAELIAAAKAKPDTVDIALPSTTARIVYELLKAGEGRAVVFGVPYKGSATADDRRIGRAGAADDRPRDRDARQVASRQAAGDVRSPRWRRVRCCPA